MRERAVLGVVRVGLAAGVALGCSESDVQSAPGSARLAFEPDALPPEVPPPPAAPPEPLSTSEIDRDGNKVDDAIDAELLSIHGTQGASASLDEMVPVSVFLEGPVTEADVRAFHARGGSVRRFYRKLAYGFQGTLPRGATLATAESLGDRLLLIEGDRAIAHHLDEATRTGRVRPVWASGFAGPGFQGSTTTTIAIIDTGVDDVHTDLAGRMVLFRDLTSDDSTEAEDFQGHGTHVAGIALGSGASFEASSNILRYTNSGDVTGLATLTFFVNPIHLPAVPLTFKSVATWNGMASGMHELFSRAQPPAGATTITTPLTAVTTPSTFAHSFTPNASLQYIVGVANFPAGVTTYAAANSITNYPSVGDGFPTLRGVAAGSRWAAYKVFTRTGGGSSLDTIFALDELADTAAANDVKVANMSLGLTGSDMQNTTLRFFANALVGSGIVTCVSAGNEGSAGIISDPGRAERVLTVGATNDINQLTNYTSRGFTPTGAGDGSKPDVLAPGGSTARSFVLAADSNDSDASTPTFADSQANDYANLQGTSMASPFAAGAAALVIEALESTGVTWSFSGSAHPLLVKMLLAASATETNTTRQNSANNPTLGRFAAPKDLEEGYGVMNPDAAVEAVRLALGSGFSGTTTGSASDRRAWGRNFSVTAGQQVTLSLAITGSADFDVYVFPATPAASGDPVFEAGSANAGVGVAENVSFVASSTGSRYLMVKRVSGSGSFTLSIGSTCGNSTVEVGEQCDVGTPTGDDCCSTTCQFEAAQTACGGAPSGPCDAQDSCDGAGTCTPEFAASGTSCGSSAENTCDHADTCDGAGVCLTNFEAATTPCGDQLPNDCLAEDACNGAGACADAGFLPSGSACGSASDTVCDDPDTCDATGTCQANNVSASCSDGNACNGAEVCGGGTCQSATAPNCNDGNVCTDDSCSPSSGCVNAPNTVSCSDGNACNGVEVCGGGSCQSGTPLNCNDGNVCTDDSCSPSSGCVNAPNTSSCADGDLCNGAEVCDGAGVCAFGVAPELDDDNPCTVDACDPVSGVTHEPVTSGTSCADADLCDGAETCDANGTCVAGAAVQCTASDECHLAGSCVAESGTCTNPNTPDGTACSLGECRAGVCTPGGGGGAGGKAGAGGTTTGGATTGGATTGGASGSNGGGRGGTSAGGSSGTGGRGNAGRGGTTRPGGHGAGGSAGEDGGAARAGQAGEADGDGRGRSVSETRGCGCRIPAKNERSGLPLALGVLAFFAVRRRRASRSLVSSARTRGLNM